MIKGENGPALDTQFTHLRDIQLNRADGSLWIADSRNNRIRAVFDVANAPGAKVLTGGGTGPLPPPPPATRPGAPTFVTATAGNGSATVSWAAPADHGGSPITSYLVTSSAGQAASVNGTTLSATVTGLTNGTAYTFTVQATNRVGQSVASAPSDSVVPTAPPTPPPAPPVDNNEGGGSGVIPSAPTTGAPAARRSGYWMVGSDGVVYPFGDAKSHGNASTTSAVDLEPTPSGKGYWLVASDGGIFAFEAGFKGSLGGVRLNKPVTGMVRAGTGYLMVGEDGGIFDFSGTPDGFKGSLGAKPPAKPITSVAVLA